MEVGLRSEKIENARSGQSSRSLSDAGRGSEYPIAGVRKSSAPFTYGMSGNSERRSYADVNLVQRTLSVLECINRLALITVGEISRQCSIPAPSVVRILETLCSEGYLTHVSRRGGYALTTKIRQLSAGCQRSSIVVETLRPIADRLTKDHLWPFAVATLEQDAMVIQYSSIPLSPLAHVRSTLHKRVSLISRAHGLAYLAFCSSKERALLLKLALERNFIEDRITSSNLQWRRILRQTRRNGYAMRITNADPFTNSIAVPIIVEPGSVMATLGMTYFRSVVKQSQIEQMASALKKAAEEAAGIIREMR
jgi:IclR family mhp operon transcriptional activator